MLVLKRVAGFVAFLGLSAGCAQAADLSGYAAPSYKDAGNYWVITIGGYGVAEPAFPGAKDYVFTGRPIIDIHQAGAKEWLALPNDAFSLSLYQTGNFRVGVAGDYLNHRQQSDAPSELKGMHNIDYTLEAGAFAEYYPVPFLRTRVEVLQGLTGAEGLEANFMADFIYRPAPQWLFTAGPRMQVVNDKFASAFFSVTNAEVACPGRHHAVPCGRRHQLCRCRRNCPLRYDPEFLAPRLCRMGPPDGRLGRQPAGQAEGLAGPICRLASALLTSSTTPGNSSHQA